MNLHRLAPFALAPVAILLASCAASDPKTPTLTQLPQAPWVDQARQVSTSVPPKLLAVLQEAIQKGGAEGAIEVCQQQAPKLAQAASQQSGWQVRRVSLNHRNPKAVPDAWEKATLEAFDRAQAQGVDPAKLEWAAVVEENGQPVRRYMRALPTGELCLQCHGPTDRLAPGVKAKLAQLYPNDKATGYLPGRIRGAMTLRQPAN